MIKKIIALAYKQIFKPFEMRQLKKLKKRDINDFDANLEYQKEKLALVLSIAFNNIPYYKKLELEFNNKNFSYSDFQKIHVLTKEIIRDENNILVNQNFKKMSQVYKNTSGGSTGEPVNFFRTKRQSNHGLANYYLALLLNGADINDSSVDFWGAERDMYKSEAKFNLRSLFQNKTVLNTFVLSDEIIESYIRTLNSVKPKFIKAYVHSIFDISKYIIKHNIKINFRPIIHCTTGPLYPEMRTEIEKAFNQARVYNFYGSREVSAIATEIIGSDDMYVLYDNVFVEILDDNNQPVKKGEEGEIVVTTLNNPYMPLLRYKIGDRGIKGDDLDFGTLKINDVLGRTLGVIHRKDGSKLDGQFFTTLFFDKKGIKQFQLVQKTISNLQLKIVKTEDFNSEELNAIVNRIKTELLDVDIDVIFCDEIGLTSTGKIMYVYSEI